MKAEKTGQRTVLACRRRGAEARQPARRRSCFTDRGGHGQVCLALLLVAVTAVAFSPRLCRGGTEPEKKTDTIAFKPKIAALYKNGLGFFVCEGEGKVGEHGELVTSSIPEAAFGTFWLGSLDPDVTLKSACASWQEVKRPMRAATIADLLRANPRKSTSLLFGEKMIEGKILAEPDAPSEKEATIVVLETSSGERVALNIAEIKRADFGKDVAQTYEKTQREQLLRILTETKKPIEDRARGTARLQMSFLQKNIAWVPSYNIDIADEKKARISMQAIVVNDAVDLEGTDLYFIVGFPNLQFADMLSPISPQQMLMQLMERYTQIVNGGVARRGIMTQVAGTYFDNTAVVGDGNGRLEMGITGYSASTMAGLEGSREEDLFFYNLKDYSLKKGERGYVNLFSGEAEYKHIYSWAVPRTIQERQTSQTPTDTQTDEVWHCIKLKNATPYPWTSAAVLTTRGWKPLGQDTLRYTPKGSETNVRITQVTDIRISRKEVESERQKNSLHLYGSDWDLVTVQGELALKSYKDKPIEMEITKQLLGEVQEATDNGAVTKRAEGLQAVNPKSEIKWNITLQPGEEKIIKYTFKIYVS